MSTALLFLALLITGLLLSCSSDVPTASNSTARPETEQLKQLHEDITKIEPFFTPMGKPGPNDWLYSHKEAGQTFDEYINGKPILPTKERTTIYVLPLGKFSAKQKKVIDIAAGYLGSFYDMPVKELREQALTRPSNAKDFRQNRYTKVLQIRTGYIMDSILQPKMPTDAAVFIALTNEDLFPDASMNYVFGQASLENRVGVWSLSRLDDGTGYDTFLRRTLKIAAHETGHMFGMTHCTEYECVMSGSNYLGETDARPIDACPECMAKICWMSNVLPKTRYEHLAAFCQKNNLTKEAEEFRRKAAAVK